ncbi:DUF3592 domain-containing protein [Actinoplanes sp. NPDC051859]|uniref:DUF3592 domain-containing protein n=1 Tax=Actinoplanes sp. NPDC051859 TaxID=3363909 RepID=UPI0037AE01A6
MDELSEWLPTLGSVLIVGIPAVAGLALISAGVRRWIRHRSLAGSGHRATAVVVDNQLQSRSEGQTHFRPVVTFRTAAGQELKTVVDLPQSRSYLTGTEFEIYYDPQRPTEVTPVRNGQRGTITYLVFGVVFLVFALFAYQLTSTMFEEFEDFGDVDLTWP